MKKNVIIVFLVMMLLIGTCVISAMSIDNLSSDDNLFTSKFSNVEWSMTYGEDRFEMLQCVQQTNDNGYIACGIKSAYDLSDGNYRPWVIKTDSYGNLEWEWFLTEMEYEGRYFSVYPDVYCMFVHQTMDNGYITGFRIHGQADDEYWICAILKLNENGEEEWREYCMDGLEWVFAPNSIIEFDDGSFLLVGQSGTTEIGDPNNFACLYRIDSIGQEQWRQEYENNDENDHLWALCKTNDNGFLLTGWKDYKDYWMIKTDTDGNKEWDKIFGGPSSDFGHCRNCYQTSDGGYIMTGYSYSVGNGQADVWIVKTDSSGNMDWNRTYGDKRKDLCWSFESINDDSFVFCVSYDFDYNWGELDIHLVNTDSDGHIIWIQKFEGPDMQIGQHICKTSDGGFIISGRTGPYMDYSSDAMLVKFAQFDNERPNKPTIDGPSNGKPDTEYTFTASCTDPDGDQIVSYMWDWGDGNFSEWLETSEASYNWTTEDKFDVKVMTIDENGGESDWSDPFEFSTPRNKLPNNQIIQRLLTQFSILRFLL